MSQLGELKKNMEANCRRGRVENGKWWEVQLRKETMGVKGRIDRLFRRGTSLCISVQCQAWGSQSEARFQAMLVRPGATDHLPLKIKVNGKRSSLEWGQAAEEGKV